MVKPNISNLYIVDTSEQSRSRSYAPTWGMRSICIMVIIASLVLAESVFCSSSRLAGIEAIMPVAFDGVLDFGLSNERSLPLALLQMIFLIIAVGL